MVRLSVYQPGRHTVRVTQTVRPCLSTPAKYEEAVRGISTAAGVVKLAVGVGNNAAWAACLDAYDWIKKHPRYRQQVRGGSTPEKDFKRFFDMMHRYEMQLRHSENCRFFRLEDMTPEVRKRYGDISNADYYDFWSSMGFQAYETSKPFFTSLVNKLRLAYQAHGVDNAEIIGWAQAADIGLRVATYIYDGALRNASKMYPVLTETQYGKVFHDFDLSAQARFWSSCVEDLLHVKAPVFTETEIKNVRNGIEQLEQKWLDERSLYESRIKTCESFGEIFRTKGEMKKAIREIAEDRDEYLRNREYEY